MLRRESLVRWGEWMRRRRREFIGQSWVGRGEGRGLVGLAVGLLLVRLLTVLVAN